MDLCQESLTFQLSVPRDVACKVRTVITSVQLSVFLVIYEAFHTESIGIEILNFYFFHRLQRGGLKPDFN